jgi:subtilisin family serine protease
VIARRTTATRAAASAVLAALLLALLPTASVAAVPSDDPLVEAQWGLAQVRAAQAWGRSTGRGVTIAVIDSGVDLRHPDLADRIVGGATFLGCPDAADGCGTGSWLDGEDAADASGHGTHVAGIAAAAAGNGIGGAGVAPDARILSVKSLPGQLGGTVEETVAGIRWAVRNGADVLNLSLGVTVLGLPGTGPAAGLVGATEHLREAIREAVAAGVVVVAAAGNDVVGVCAEPAFDPQVLCVAATDRQERPTAYSNLPIDPARNAVSAPGGAALLRCADDVLSTWPVDAPVEPCQEQRGYNALAGTSMAAPHVSGVAALLLAQGRSAADVVSTLRSTARDPLTGRRGSYSPTHGYGIIDAEAAVATPPPDVVERVAGGDRTATAAAVSARTFARADTVVLARAPLAARRSAPVLLTARHRLSPAAAEEIGRLGATRAILLGRESAISDDVRAELEARGVAVTRIGGSNRFATAALVAAELGAEHAEVLVTEGGNPNPGRGWPDALSASGLAAGQGIPILLVSRDVLPAETAAALRTGQRATIVGGTGAVSEAVADQIRRRTGAVDRLAGRTRYATSVAVAEDAVRRGANPATTWLATGRSFADGLVAGAAAGVGGAVLVLIDGQQLDGSPDSRDLLARRRGSFASVRLVGGTAAISPATAAAVRDLVR